MLSVAHVQCYASRRHCTSLQLYALNILRSVAGVLTAAKKFQEE